MYKDQEIKFEDTNVANLGSDLEKKIKLAAAQTEKAWEGAGKSPGLEIWRIEKFQVVPWPKDQYGSFYSGDSYIILYTYKKVGQDALEWNAHMWVGEFTTKDEAGTAAYKIVELDDILERQAVLYREVQGHESELFLSYFAVMHILDGGVESGFKKVPVEEYKPRLLHIKGKKNFRVRQVPLTAESLNKGDVFILDHGLNIYVWSGSKANSFEKFKAASIAKTIDEERQSLPKVFNLDEDNNEDAFWSLLGGKSQIKNESSVKDEEIKKDVIMLQLSDQSGQIELKEVKPGKETLNSNDVFLIDIGYELMIWIGSKASSNEKRNAFGYAAKYLNDYNRPHHLPLCVMNEGKESECLQEAFN
jgi:gelsolin